MFISTKKHRSLLAVAAIGAIGFSSYGLFNTVNAFNDIGKSLPSDYTIQIAADNGSFKPDGTFCNPYGCAGCDGCVGMQYQQNVKETTGLTMDFPNEN
jgi:hypothetical protein